MPPFSTTYAAAALRASASCASAESPVAARPPSSSPVLSSADHWRRGWACCSSVSNTDATVARCCSLRSCCRRERLRLPRHSKPSDARNTPLNLAKAQQVGASSRLLEARRLHQAPHLQQRLRCRSQAQAWCARGPALRGSAEVSAQAPRHHTGSHRRTGSNLHALPSRGSRSIVLQDGANVMLQALHRGSGHCEAIKNSGPVHGAGGEHGDQAKRATATYGVM